MGAQETRGEKEKQVPHDFGGPPGFAPTSWAQATGSSRVQPDTRPNGFEDFARLTRPPRRNEDSPHAPNPQQAAKTPPSPPNHRTPMMALLGGGAVSPTNWVSPLG